MTKTQISIILGLVALAADTVHKFLDGAPIDWAVVIGAATAASAALSAHAVSNAVSAAAPTVPPAK